MALRCTAALVLLLAGLLAAGPAAAPAADETRNYLVDPTHSNAVPDSPLVPGLRLRWQANLGTPSSPVLVTGGRVLYVRQPGTGPKLTALDAASGRELWSQDLPSGSHNGYGLAADGGRLFVLHNASADYRYGVRVRALDPANGAPFWERTIDSEYGLGSQPTADRGQLFFLASSGSSSLHALRQSDGTDLWAPKGVTSGDSSAPTLDGGSVYVSVAGPQTFSFDRNTGAQRWHYKGCCTGGGGGTTRLHAGRLYAQESLVHDAGNGQVVGSWNGSPAFAGDGGVEAVSNGLRGFGPGYGTTRWQYGQSEYSSDGYNAPLIAGSHAYVSKSGHQLAAVRVADGVQTWCQRLTLPPGSGSSSSSSGDTYTSPVAAGQGLLLVAVGYGLAAFESGGPPSSCETPRQPGGTGTGTGTRPQTTTPVPAGRPGLSLSVGRTTLLLGERTNVVAKLTGTSPTGGRRVVLDLDEWPFDGRWKPGASALTLQDGSAAFKLGPRRNVAVRARLVDDPAVTSLPVEVFADFPYTARKLGAGGPRPRLLVRELEITTAKVRTKTVFAYLARGDAQPWRLVDRRRWQRLSKRSASVALRYPRGRLTKRDHWLVCTREPRPDAFGRATELDRRCGERRLPRTVLARRQWAR